MVWPGLAFGCSSCVFWWWAAGGESIWLLAAGVNHSMAVESGETHGWADLSPEIMSSQESLVELSEMAEACRSETDASDSLPDNSLWWVNPLKCHTSCFARPLPSKIPRSLLAACSGAGSELMVMKAAQKMFGSYWLATTVSPALCGLTN